MCKGRPETDIVQVSTEASEFTKHDHGPGVVQSQKLNSQYIHPSKQ